MAKMIPPKLQALIDKIRSLPEFETVDFQDINSTNHEGENALHVAVRWNDTEAVQLLIKEGININQPGDLGHTPLHEACSSGNMEIVKILVEAGVDLFALTEGNPPFTLARFGKHDEICDYLAVEMKRKQQKIRKFGSEQGSSNFVQKSNVSKSALMSRHLTLSCCGRVATVAADQSTIAARRRAER
jgi:ankyrin repeat protein